MLPAITLILGGARSGKSRHAETLVESSAAGQSDTYASDTHAPGTCVYVATGEAGDEEMRQRIAAHRARRGGHWRTVEAPLDLIEALRAAAAPGTVVLVDCLTLWLANLMAAGRDPEAETDRLLAGLGQLAGPVVFVANEVGLGIVPDNALARAFRDHAGRLNQRLAAAADRVEFVAAGLPMVLKQAAAARPLFDGYLMVDWSGAGTPKRGADSIWYGLAERDGDRVRLRRSGNPATRFEALKAVAALLHRAVADGRRILVGFDFPHAYPQGFAAAAGFGDAAPWRAVWQGLYDLIDDGDDNRNNRFAVAAELNRRISGGGFPFWGCPPRQETEHLSVRKPAGYGGARLAERRLVEQRQPKAQSCWKLYTTGSVGSQALLGIPILKMLRDDPELAPRVRAWPFETGLTPPDPRGDWRIVLAEIYPSLLALPPLAGRPKDQAQVETMALHFADLDQRGELARHFAGPEDLAADQRAMIEAEEGWILGVGTLTV